MAEEDTWPISDVWYYHDWHNHRYGSKTFSELYKEGMDRKLGPSDNLDDFCKKAQLINYESHRAIFEAWNSKMWNDASGVLLWMSHPAWLVWFGRITVQMAKLPVPIMALKRRAVLFIFR